MKTIEKKYLLPFALVTSLFLLWGLANNMTDTLLSAFRKIMNMSDTRTAFIQMAFYGAYFCVALPAAMFIRRYSFKSGVILGLALYATGAILFLPAAKAASYTFYLIAIYIMASGCSVLETTANPYIMSMGSAETATRRLNIAQSFNPIGSIAGILMSKYFILQEVSLYSISGTYVSLGIVLVFLMTVMIFSKMPKGHSEGTDSSLLSTFGRLSRNKDYMFGIVAQFFYVGAQIGVWSYTIRIVKEEMKIQEAEASTIYLASVVAFCLSRFVYTWLMKYIKPSKLLLFSGVTSTICATAVSQGQHTGWFMIIMLIAISLFMSLMFPTIYGIALGSVVKSKTPTDAKIGASGLIMSILGGALITPLQGYVSDMSNIYTSYLVPAICFFIVLLYSIYTIKRKID